MARAMLRGVLKALAALFGALSGAAAFAQSVEVALRSQAEVPAPVYVLSDVAQVRAQDPKLLRRLSGLRIGKSPRAGDTQTLERDQIERVVNRALPQLRSKARWSGASKVTLTARAQSLEGERLIEAAVRAAFAHYGNQFRPLELRPVSRLDKLAVPQGQVSLDARLVPAATLAKRLCVLVDVRVDGEDYTMVPVWFAVKAVRPTLVAKTALRAGQRLRREDFAVRATDVTALASPPVEAVDDLDLMRLRQKVEARGALLQSSIEPRPAVARDQVVQVKIMHAAVAIEASGVAARDARIGESIKVRNPASAQWFVATVTGDGEVEVR